MQTSGLSSTLVAAEMSSARWIWWLSGGDLLEARVRSEQSMRTERAVVSLPRQEIL